MTFVTWYCCRDRVSSCNIYADQQDTQFLWLSFIHHVSSACFGPHRSIFRGVCLQAVCAEVVCGNPCITRHVQPLWSFLQLRNGWTCRVIRVLPHTKSAHTACKQTLLKMDKWGPKHVQLTYVMNKIQSKNFVYLVGLHIYYMTSVSLYILTKPLLLQSLDRQCLHPDYNPSQPTHSTVLPDNCWGTHDHSRTSLPFM